MWYIRVRFNGFSLYPIRNRQETKWQYFRKKYFEISINLQEHPPSLQFNVVTMSYLLFINRKCRVNSFDLQENIFLYRLTCIKLLRIRAQFVYVYFVSFRTLNKNKLFMVSIINSLLLCKNLQIHNNSYSSSLYLLYVYKLYSVHASIVFAH